MDKKYLINVTSTTVVNLESIEEAEVIANILANREGQNFAGNLMYVTSEVKELTNAN